MHIILFGGLFAILCLRALGHKGLSGSRPITGSLVKILRIVGQFLPGGEWPIVSSSFLFERVSALALSFSVPV